MKLKECATIRTGLILARKTAKIKGLENMTENYRHLTLKSFSPQGKIDHCFLEETTYKEVLDEKYLTQEADIVMRMTQPYTAILIEKEDVGLVITSNFVCIRVNSKEINPAFLCWVLNSKENLQRLQILSSSITLGSVSPQTISDLPVIQVPFEKQEKIGALAKLFLKEELLLARLQICKEKIHQQTLQNIYKTLQ